MTKGAMVAVVGVCISVVAFFAIYGWMAIDMIKDLDI